MYVFLGSYSEVIGRGIRLTRFGERVELPADLAEETKHATGLPCIPAEQFDAIGFTEAELKQYPTAAHHERREFQLDGTLKRIAAPDSFLSKKAKALQVLHEIREQHAAGQPEAAAMVAEFSTEPISTEGSK